MIITIGRFNCFTNNVQCGFCYLKRQDFFACLLGYKFTELPGSTAGQTVFIIHLGVIGTEYKNKIIDNHKIEGIGDDFIPKIVEKDKIDKIILVNDDDAINMSRKIALELGIGVGISSGANMIASVLAKEENEGNIVTVFPDDNKKYLSTDLSKPIDNNENYISNKIKN